jgi:hypothetical protein
MKRQLTLPLGKKAPEPASALSNSQQYHLNGLLEWLEYERETPKTKRLKQGLGFLTGFIEERYGALAAMRASWRILSNDERAKFRQAIKDDPELNSDATARAFNEW